VTREELLLLANFDGWATDRLLGVAARLPAEAWTRPVDSRLPCLRDACVHLVSGAVVWLARWQGRPLTTGLRAVAFASAAALQQRWHGVASARREFLEAVPTDQLLSPLAYRTASGRERREVLALTVVHQVSHAAYHRGQIVTTLRLLGGAMVHTDLLHFLRTGGPARA
jgi:uncharacterized damage-inducible protein DinB